MAVTWPSKNNFANGDVLTAANMNNIGDTLNVFDPTSATNGQVWTANGSGSGSYQTVSGGMTLIQSISLTSGTRHTVSAIPGSYQSLYCRLANCTITGGPTSVGIEINGLTNFYKMGRRFVSSSPTVTADAYDSTYMTGTYTMLPFGVFNFDTLASGNIGQAHAWIHDYARASTKYKTIYTQVTGQSSSLYYNSEVLGFNYNASADAAITSVAVYANGATFQGGLFQVYGVK